MARTFQCNTKKAEEVAAILRQLQSDVLSRRSSGQHLDSTGSQLIDYALREFVTAAVQAETDLAKTLTRTAFLFEALAKGAINLDRTFAMRRK